MTPESMAEIHALAFDGSRNWSAKEISTLLTHPGTVAFGDFRAFGIVRVTLDEAELLTIATHPDHQKRGLGRAWLSEAENIARHAGARTMFLEVSENNEAAIGLYRSAGYSQAGLRRGYYRQETGPAVAALILSKPLIEA